MDDPVSTSARATLVIHTGEGTVIKVNDLSANTAGEAMLIARTVKLYVADADGVPDKTPAVLIRTPGGSVLEDMLKPVAAAFAARRLAEKRTPWLVFARMAAVVRVGDVATIQVNVRSAMAIGEVPTALIVKLYDPETDGVPVNAPGADSAIPVGNVEPLFTE